MDENSEHKVHHEHKEGEHHHVHHEHKEGEHHKVHHEHHAHAHHKKTGLTKLDTWRLATAAMAILLVISILTAGFGMKSAPAGTTTDTPAGGLSEDAAADKAIEYVNANLLQPGMEAELKSVEEKGSLYIMNMDIGGRDYESYITKDGNYLFPSGFDMNEEVEAPEAPQQQPSATVTTKSAKPEVDLFVMSHCPYGTQAEKGMLPVAKLLGDKIDLNVRFVYYAMHGETEVLEQLNQYCIQKEQNSKFLDYLECFLGEGEGEKCLTETGIDADMLATCTEAADEEFSIKANLEDESSWLNGRFPKFDTDKALNEKYGVGGSPSLVINGESISSARDPASYLAAVCSSFEEAPEECDTDLGSASPGPGFGWTESEQTTLAQCG